MLPHIAAFLGARNGVVHDRIYASPGVFVLQPPAPLHLDDDE
jgi:hypothetical protein